VYRPRVRGVYPPRVRGVYPPNTPTITKPNNQPQQPNQQPLVNEDSPHQTNSHQSTKTTKPTAPSQTETAQPNNLESTVARLRLGSRTTQPRTATPRHSQPTPPQTGKTALRQIPILVRFKYRHSYGKTRAGHSGSRRFTCGSFADQTQLVFFLTPFFYK
jgi:hypothetical protein